MTPLRLVQVGMGGWGRDWARMLARHPELAQTVAFVDVQPEMLELLRAEVAAAAGACFGSLEDALAASDADAVLVTTALAGHIPVVLAALAAGKHVLVEKPFGPSLAEAQAAVDAAAAANKVLMVSQNYRFYPAAQAVAGLIRAGTLGAVGAVTVHFRKYANTPPRATNRHYAIMHPLLMDMSIHHFDLLRYVLGQEPVAVTCHAWNPPWSHFTDPAAAIAAITFDGGAVVDYHGSWVSTAPQTLWGGAWRIECERGTIDWTERDNTTTAGDAVTVRERGKRPRKLALEPMPNFDRAGSVAAFAAAIRSGTPPMTSGADNLRSLALMFGTIAAAETGQPQQIDALLTGAAAHTTLGGHGA